MANNIDPRFTVSDGVARRGTADASVDQGLRTYMLGVYNMMALGVALTGVVAYLVGSNEALMQMIYAPPLRYVVMFAPLAVVMFFSFRINQMSAGTAQLTFWVYAALVGASISFIFTAYTGGSVAKIFFITAAAFGSLSLYGYTTQKNLSGWGTFLFMGVIGVVIASLVNIWLKSEMISFVTSIIGVLIFAGLTAYDTQKIKSLYYAGDSHDAMSKKITCGALQLYLDFLNMFMFLLRLFGGRR